MNPRISQSYTCSRKTDFIHRLRTPLLFMCFPLSYSMLAQSQPATDETESRPRGQLDEIVVTARFREENLQQTPLAISAITNQALEDNGATNVIDVGNMVPNVTIDLLGSGYGPTLAANVRGLGFGDFKPTSEPTMTIYVDDVVLGRPTGAILDLLDLERVEMLRGPQGTLFGKNAIGGVLRLISVKPGEGANPGRIEVTAGKYDRLDVRGAFETPIIEDELFGRISFSSKQRDGWQDNIDFACQMLANGTPELAGINDGIVGWNAEPNIGPATGPGTPVYGEVGSEADNAFALTPRTTPTGTTDGCRVGTLGEERVQAARATVRWLPSDMFELNVTYDITDESNTQPYDLLTTANTDNPPPLLSWFNNVVALPTWGIKWDDRFVPDDETVNYSGFNTSSIDGKMIPNKQDVRHWGLATTADFYFDNFDIKLIVAKRQFDAQWGRDSDASPLPINHTLDTFIHDQFSTELRISGQMFNGMTDWTAGYFYYDASDRNSNISVLMPCLFATSCYDRVDIVDTENNGIFLNTNTRLTDELTLTLGVRRTEDDKYIVQERYLWDGSAFWEPQPVSAEAEQTNPMVSLSYQWSDDIMLYSTWQEGFRGGGTTARPTPTTRVPFGPEELENLEFGIKSDWFDNALRVNATYYFMTYTDMQIGGAGRDANNNVAWLTTNGGEAEIEGLELNVDALLGDHWAVNATLGTIDFQFTDLAFSDPQTRIDLGLDPGAATDVNSVPGRTPDMTASLTVSYSTPLNNGSQLRLHYGVSYQDETYFGENNDPLTRSPAYSLSNARATWTSPGEVWEASLFMTNLDDERGIQSRLNFRDLFGSIQTTYVRPREWGLTVRRNFF